MKRLLRIGIVVLLVLAVTITTSVSPSVSINSNNGFISISVGNVKVSAAGDVNHGGNSNSQTIKPPDYNKTQRSEAISVSTLGTNQDKAATSPWTALTGLSLTANDYVFVCDSADAGSSAVNVKHAAVSPTYSEQFITDTTHNACYGTTKLAQTFLTTAARNITAVALNLEKYGSPSGNIVVSLKAIDGDGKPTGDDLASNTSLASSVTTGYNTFSMSYSLLNATTYAIVVSVPNGDASNNIYWHSDASAGYASGKGCYWAVNHWEFLSEDLNFKIEIVPGYAAQDISLTADVTATNAGNVVSKIWSGQVSVTGTAWYIVITNTSTAKAMTAYKASGLADSALDKYVPGTGTGTAPSSGATSALTQADELIIGCIGVEDELADVDGVWDTGAGNVSGNEQRNGTSSGGDASNITVCGAAEVVSATTAQTASQTGNDSTDWGACVATYKMAAGFDISNTPSSKAFGVVAASTTYYAYGSAPSNPVVDGECTFTVTNNGATTIDLDMKVSDFTGGVGWNIAGAVGENTVKITTYYSGQNPASGLVLANTDAEFYDGLAASAHIHWDFRLDTGTFTDGVAKTAILTITAVSED